MDDVLTARMVHSKFSHQRFKKKIILAQPLSSEIDQKPIQETLKMEQKGYFEHFALSKPYTKSCLRHQGLYLLYLFWYYILIIQ